MRTYKALISYDLDDGKIIAKESITVMFTHGEPNPKDQVISIDLPNDNEWKQGRCILLSIKMLEKACGLKIKRVRK